MGHQDTKLTSMRRRLKEINDNPYIAKTQFVLLLNVLNRVNGFFHSGYLYYISQTIIN